MIVNINDVNSLLKILKENSMVVLYFYAIWNHNCIKFEKIFYNIIEYYRKLPIVFCKIDIDLFPNIIDFYKINIFNLPCVVMIKNNNIINMIYGLKPKTCEDSLYDFYLSR